MVSAELSFVHVTALRFCIGFVTLFLMVSVSGTSVAVPVELVPSLVLLALVPGLLALVLYYAALRNTLASRATLAELMFPLTAAAVGISVLDGRLDASQWLGFACVLASVVSLAAHERRAEPPAVVRAH
jgi:drug/metabolite transporter (DMT)-like permease